VGNRIILEAEVAIKRWMYRGGRPNGVAKFLNGISAKLHTTGIAPDYLVTLEVVGRRSGKVIRFPLAMTVMDGERYLVSMLGKDANWVQNLKATGGKATLRHGRDEQVLLEEIDVGLRAPILKAYLRHAPGARPHIPVDKDAPLSEFEKIAAQYPVFRVTTIA
jgi:deazaflavin-dependent oxidoreductase (nitroreductase family)